MPEPTAYRCIKSNEPVELLDLLLWHGPRPSYRPKVEQMAQLMRDGIEFPALRVVIGLDGAFWQPTDGHHRAGASQLAGFSHCPCIVTMSPAGTRRAR